MSVAQRMPPTSVSAQGAITRVASIDVFRGLTMMVMIFVNDLAGVSGLPWWTYHAHEQQDLMTYVDMVFPFFLFIVGMAMPLAITRRLEKHPSYLALWLHVAARSVGLVVLGLILANAEKGDPALMHISNAAWALLALAGAILLWLVPGRNARHVSIYRGLRLFGIVLLVGAFAIFRRHTESGGVAWIDPGYPEILGIIGFTYFAVALLYIPTRRWLWAPFAWFIALTAFCALTTAHLLHVPGHLPFYLWPFGAGDSASITMAGVVTSTIFLGKHRWQSLQHRMLLALAFALSTLAAAWLFIPLGISKIRATPTWCLASIGASVLAFMLLYWICEVKGQTRWAMLVKPAGENTLLTYLLPDIYYYLALLLSFTYFDRHFNTGAAGVASAVVFTLVILAISAVLTRMRVRLQL
jgi:heparan-alpha-glucosaminide N-acetyltransferase